MAVRGANVALSDSMSNALISGYVRGTNATTKPFLLTRVGNAESIVAYYVYNNDWDALEKDHPGILNELRINAGVYPVTKEMVEFYTQEYTDAIRKSTIIGRWGVSGTFLQARQKNRFHIYQDMLIQNLFLAENGYQKIGDIAPRYTPIHIVHPRALSVTESVYARIQPTWARYLTGKRVLFVSPFAKTMEMQYGKRELLWPKQYIADILPEMRPVFVRAPFSAAGNTPHDSWRTSLEKTDEAIKSVGHFDVALLSCGAYGMPLANRIHQRNMSAIYVGGALQLSFGIKGRRWEGWAFFKEFVNEHWVRPSADETPDHARLIEGATYW